MHRRPAPWRGRKQRPLYQACFALIPLWGAVLAVILVAESRAPELPGRVTGRHAMTDRRGTSLEHIDYVYTDADGTEHADERELMPSIAQRVAPAEDAPVRVKLVFGALPVLVGAPDVLPIVAVVGMAIFALFGIIFLASDRSEAAKIALALRGQLALGHITSVRKSSFKGTETLQLSYLFQTHNTAHAGQDRVSARSGELSLVLGLDRIPAMGDAVAVAYDPDKPARSTITSFGEDEDREAPATRLAPLPSELDQPAPRPLPVGAPTFATEMPLVPCALLGLALLGLALSLLLVRDPNTFVGLAIALLFTASFFGTFVTSSYLASVHAKRRLLANGRPYAALLLHVEWLNVLGQRWLSLSFELHTPEGRLRGKERLRFGRLSRMLEGRDGPQAGDTLFLVCQPDAPWERVVWGFARA